MESNYPTTQTNKQINNKKHKQSIQITKQYLRGEHLNELRLFWAEIAAAMDDQQPYENRRIVCLKRFFLMDTIYKKMNIFGPFSLRKVVHHSFCRYWTWSMATIKRN